MTHIINKQELNIVRNSSHDIYRNQQQFKLIILNYLFRNITFTNRSEKIRILNKLEYTQISNKIELPISIVHQTISKFLDDLARFKVFLRSYTITSNLKKGSRKVQIYLHKVYRLAPVFNYRRAKHNLEILNSKLKKMFFWPHIMTQVAIIIFATDLRDINLNKRIIQSNLRSLCNISAYAFHRSRNKIGC